ncbi:60S ribosomal protein L29 [Sciurus carolinensis]|uniref:60S ribosomal protein L29 n=1 Tax=Sciurus carolinensis TaxID=30640 RepID=A0AA41NDU7_SCICA|nr:60S ribosomal protein L29 [Sciurus carolinensis]
MQANNAKAMCRCAKAVKALVKPKEIKPKMPKGASCKLYHLALLAHPKHGKHAHAHMARERRPSWPKAKAQAKSRATTPVPVSASTLAPAKCAQAAKDDQVPVKAP